MIELVIVMVLLAIVMGLVTNALLGGFRATAKSMTHRKAEHIVQQALDQMANDLRSARAPHRSVDAIRERRQLRRAVLENQAIYDPRDPQVIAGPLDVYDVKEATGNRMSFISDVLPDTVDGSDGLDAAELNQMFECVTYYAETVGATWAVVREVAADIAGGCPAAGKRSFLVPPQSTAFVTPPAAVFSYSISCGDNDGSDGLTCVGGITGPGANPCQAASVAAAAGARLNYIVAVTLNLQSFVEREADASARRDLRGSVGLRTRQNHDYRYSLGCEE